MKRATNGGDAADNPDNDIVWGAVAIGKVIGRNERQVRHMLDKGYLPATKTGDQWSASRTALIATVTGAR